MKRHKSSIIALIASTVLIGSSLTINAYLNDTNLKLSRVADNENNVSLQIEDIDNMVKSFSLSLSLEDATLNKIEWSPKIKNSGKANFIKNDDNTIDIYVTSNEDLVNEEGNLEIGKINVSGNIGDTYNVSLNNNKKSIKLVTTNNKEVVSNNVEVAGDANFTISDIKVPDNDNNIKDPDADKPEVDKPAEDVPPVDKPDTDKPSEDVPPVDKPDTDKPSEDVPPVNKPDTDKPSEDVPPVNKPEVDKPSTDKPGNDNTEVIPPVNDSTTDNKEENKPGNDIEEEINKVESSNNETVEESNKTENTKTDKENSKTGDTSLRNIVFLMGLGITSIMTMLVIFYNKFSYKGKH